MALGAHEPRTDMWMPTLVQFIEHIESPTVGGGYYMVMYYSVLYGNGITVNLLDWEQTRVVSKAVTCTCTCMYVHI